MMIINQLEQYNEIRKRPIFICGHPKAGTSLVRAIFDSHPELIVYPEETVFFRRFLPQAENLKLEDKLRLAEQTLIQIFEWQQENPPANQEGYPDRDYSDVSFDKVNHWMRDFIHSSYHNDGDILSAAVLAYGQVSDQIHDKTSHWVEKSPYNEYYAKKIFNWWPDARCIHVLRDPRDNFVSYRRKHPDWEAEFFASNWRRSTAAGLKNQECFHPERYYILRYEDLTASPETVIRELVDFLNVSWDPSLTNPTRDGKGWEGNSMFSNKFEGISAAPVARWKEKLASQDAKVIECITGPLLEQFQYAAGAYDNNAACQARWRVRTWPIRRKLRRFKQAKPQNN
jgi:protein-tyrosine sulfotransferase